MKPAEIRAFREKLGLSQEAFAPLVGVSFGTINRWERGINKPSRLGIEKIKTLAKDRKCKII